jgi:FkbM family methyltransferase
MTIISYAQAKEDIHLLRALTGVSHEVGFYIDVGAWDPEIDSVTKLFYDHGWRGINIEPSPKWFPRLLEQRPRDINLQVAVSETPDEITFYPHEDGGLGTTVETIADLHERNGYLRKQGLMVKTATLTQICDKHAPKEIHFLKLDVEGGEGSALRSMDFRKHRPWILCIESHLPLHPDIQIYDEWDSYVLNAGYDFAFTDNINRYYIAKEHGERRASFAFPSDCYIHANDIRRVTKLEENIASVEATARNAIEERDAAIAELQRTISERDALAAASTRWFKAVIAVTPDHNPLTPRKQHRWRTNLVRHVIGRYHSRSPIALADRARDAGRWELAVRYYRDALDVDPEDLEIWMQCGLALEKAGKTSEAEMAFRRSRELQLRGGK